MENREKLEKLDLKDRKILYYLDLNSRQSFSQIGKKVGMHKDVVAYRVNKFLEKGLIKFVTIINEHKLGICYLRFCLTYQYVTPEIKKEIIEYFIKNKYTVAIHTAEGLFDLVVILGVKNTPAFYNIWYQMISKYRDYFSKRVFSVYCGLVEYKLTFLLEEKEQKKEDRVLFNRFDDGKTVVIDDLDYKILYLLNNNARMPTIEIANTLNTAPVTINNRIKKLIKSGVILGFRLGIDYSRIDYHFYEVGAVLKNSTQIEKIIQYIESNAYLVGRIMSLGYVDLQFLLFLKNADELQAIMNDLCSKFPDTIKDYTYFIHTRTVKFQYLPEVII